MKNKIMFYTLTIFACGALTISKTAEAGRTKRALKRAARGFVSGLCCDDEPYYTCEPCYVRTYEPYCYECCSGRYHDGYTEIYPAHYGRRRYIAQPMWGTFWH